MVESKKKFKWNIQNTFVKNLHVKKFYRIRGTLSTLAFLLAFSIRFCLWSGTALSLGICIFGFDAINDAVITSLERHRGNSYVFRISEPVFGCNCWPNGIGSKLYNCCILLGCYKFLYFYHISIDCYKREIGDYLKIKVYVDL